MKAGDQTNPSSKTSFSRFVGSGAEVAFIRIVGLAITFLLHLLLARMMQDDVQYGIYAWSQTLLFLIGMLATLGIPVTATRFIAALRSQGEDADIPGVVTRAVVLSLRSSCALWLVAAGLYFFRASSSSESQYYDLILIALLLAPLVTLGFLVQQILRGYQRFTAAFLPMQVLRPLFTLTFAALIWSMTKAPLDGVSSLLAVGAGLFLALLIQLFVSRRALYRRHQINPNPAIPEYSPSRIMQVARPLFAVRCANLTMVYANTLVVGALAGPAPAAAYFVADRLANLSAIPRTVVSAVIQPMIAGAHAAGDKAGLQRIVRHGCHGNFWPTLAASAFLVTFSAPLLNLFGSEYSDAANILFALVAASFIQGMTGPSQDLLTMAGHHRLVMRLMLIIAPLHLTILVLLTVMMGPFGAALSNIFSALAVGTMLVVMAYRLTGHKTTILPVFVPIRMESSESGSSK